MRGTSSPASLCARAKELGYSALALTDHNSLSGLWSFLTACKDHAMQPLVGAEITDTSSSAKVICLVRNSTGYRNVCNIITKRNSSEGFSLEKELRKQHDGLIILSSSLSLLSGLQKYPMDIAANLGNRPTESSSRLRRWAQNQDIPVVAVPNVVMAEEREKELFRLMQAIRTNSRFTLQEVKNTSPAWLEAAAVYRDRFSVWPEVLPATGQLVERCDFTNPNFGIVMPPWKDDSGAEAGTALYKAAYRGACKRYGTDLSEAVVERLEYELHTIDSMGFSSYFLVVRDIVHNLSGENPKRTPRICGRGSGAASLVAYCLEITNVCPVKHNLYFARFLNPGRSDPPDIDIDFSWDERDAILNRVLEKYGTHAAMVSTLIRFQPRMALRETAKAFGLPPGEIAKVTNLQRLPGAKNEGLASPWPEILQLASELHGVPRHISVHPGGVIITPDPISDYVPLQIAAKGVPVIQWDKDGAEEAGLVKIDLLGNRSLGVIRDCIASLEERGPSFDEDYWQPEEDRQTKETVAAGKTMGCFYIESPAMRLLQQKAGSGEFEQLVLQSSIIRPAANDFVREYIRRLHGGTWQHLHPQLAEVLDETFGLMVYQEDVSRVAVALAGFSHARADGLRKVMSKKDKLLRLKDYYREFDEGCAQRGVDAEIREKLWQMMMSFDGYSFCKPHSASYARVSYQAAYLKSHYPAEFMAAVISNQGGYYSTFAYVSEAKRLGLSILPPCVNASGVRWKGNGREKNIRVGLMAVKGLSAETMERIRDKRSGNPFSSAVDFWQRVRPQKDESRALIQAGALDDLTTDRNRSRLFWELSQFRCLAKMQQTSPLFGLRLPQPPALQPFSQRELQRQEYGVLGFLCETHPILLYGKRLNGRTQACNIRQHRGKRVTFAGWLISGKLVSTKTGEVMEFLTFEDETGLVETVFFPRIYRRYAPVLSSGQTYMLRGKVEEDYGAVTLTVEHLQKL
ncbi:MAG: DNA polymerase III subunit alpha [Desulfocapsa sp.]|nr:DNA polymerase III subunit alpha [Desulfocapsa sp.]